MSHTKVGACPRCGAPIYAATVWHGILPPPSTATCGCAGSGPRIVTTPHTGTPVPTDTMLPLPEGSAS